MWEHSQGFPVLCFMRTRSTIVNIIFLYAPPCCQDVSYKKCWRTPPMGVGWSPRSQLIKQDWYKYCSVLRTFRPSSPFYVYIYILEPTVVYHPVASEPEWSMFRTWMVMFRTWMVHVQNLNGPICTYHIHNVCVYQCMVCMVVELCYHEYVNYTCMHVHITHTKTTGYKHHM